MSSTSKALTAVRLINRTSKILKKRLMNDGAAPDFLIIGAQKAGTTSLFDYIMQSPQARRPLVKEIHFFDQFKLKPLSWYLGHFPSRQILDDYGCVSGEATPFYLFHPAAAERISRLGLQPKIIVILRRPEERAYSHWNHEKRKGREPLCFAEALDMEQERLRHNTDQVLDRAHLKALRNWSYFSRGLYQSQIQRYAKIFGRDRVLVITLDALSIDPVKTVAKVCRFIGIVPPDGSAFEIRNKGPEIRKPPSEAMAMLKRRYIEQNSKLKQWIDEPVDWIGKTL